MHRPPLVLRRAAAPLLTAVCVLALVTAVLAGAVLSGPSTGRTPARPLPAPRVAAGASAKLPFVATLNTDPMKAPKEAKAGVKMAMLELSWRGFEPKDNQWDSHYVKVIRSQIHRFHAAGMQITLGLGLQYTPSWVLARRGSRFVDQTGHQSDKFDLVFNQKNRSLVIDYLGHVKKAFGLGNFWAIRLTSGGPTEMLYPNNGRYWAFSKAALSSTERPPSLHANPLPNWRPGHAGPSTAAKIAWEKWYVGALANVADWQMSALRTLGYGGYFQLVTPGLGVLPWYRTALARRNLPDGVLGAGAEWSLFYGQLYHHRRVTAYLSSVGDGSGHNSGCAASDSRTPLTSAAIKTWSSTRWIAYLARRHGLSVSGENPGYPSSASARKIYSSSGTSGLMSHVSTMTRSCHFLGFYWAHDAQIWSGKQTLAALVSLTK